VQGLCAGGSSRRLAQISWGDEFVQGRKACAPGSFRGAGQARPKFATYCQW